MGHISESSKRSILITSGILGTLQGLTWTTLSILSILFYHKVFEPFSINDLETGDSVDKILYIIFLNNEISIPVNLIIHPSTFNIFMYFYAILSIAWIFISSYIIIKAVHQKTTSTKFMYIYIWIWSALTFILSIIDLVLMILIAIDFNAWNESISDNVKTSYWLVISLALRVYLLWIVNLILSIIMIKIGLELKQNENSSLSNQHYINAYESRSVLDFERPSDQRASNNPYAFVNNSYQQDEVDTAAMQHKVDEYFNFKDYESNNQYSTPYREGNHYYSNLNHFRANNENKSPDVYYSNPSNIYFEPNKSALHTSNNNKVATIGRKQGKRTPPYQVPPPVAPNLGNPPYIPPPDYSPPGSPQNERRIKPALKTTSNYRY